MEQMQREIEALISSATVTQAPGDIETSELDDDTVEEDEEDEDEDAGEDGDD